MISPFFVRAATTRTKKGEITLSSRLTGQSQVFVPKVVRQVLGLSQGETLEYVIHDGAVTVRAQRDSDSQRDPAIDSFLELLTTSISKGDVVPVAPAWLERAQSAVGKVDFNRREILEGTVDLG